MGNHLALMPAGLTADEVLVWHATAGFDALVNQGSWDPDPSDLLELDDGCWDALAVMAGHPSNYTGREREVIAQALIERYEPPTTCWCGRRVSADDAVEGTCGSSVCLQAEAMDRAGLVP